MSVKRLFAAAGQYFLRRSLPHGIISWRYLLPNPPAKVRIHRQLWFTTRDRRIPLPLFLLIELLLWLRWVTFACWHRSWRAVQLRGPEICAREGIGKGTLLLRLLTMSLCHCISPAEIFAFGLYRSDSSHKVWEYVFSHETSAFHRWRDVRPGESAAALALIQDKSGLAALLASHGVPMAPVLAVIPRGASFNPDPWLHDTPRLFCKPRHGSASRDAFVIERRDDRDTPAIFAVMNGMKMRHSSMDALHKALAGDDFLVQPLMGNHPLFAPLVLSEDAVTLRIITELHPDQGIRCYSATLEIPHLAEDGNLCHTILPIEQLSGLICPFPERHLPATAQARHAAVLVRLGDCAVPFWGEIKSSAMTAHRQLPELYAIAWDYVIPPSGPCMLEGNSGWGMTTPQVLHGGLLRD
ncbi:MAG: hypothetical protein M0T70_11850 [Geobacteraceae bacterium]|nr:hypothetical protein [Geobacteraceae bacterium]